MLVVDLLACENICFSSLFAAGEVSRGGDWVAHVPPRETSPPAKSEEKRMFSQAMDLYVGGGNSK